MLTRRRMCPPPAPSQRPRPRPRRARAPAPAARVAGPARSLNRTRRPSRPSSGAIPSRPSATGGGGSSGGGVAGVASWTMPNLVRQRIRVTTTIPKRSGRWSCLGHRTVRNGTSTAASASMPGAGRAARRRSSGPPSAAVRWWRSRSLIPRKTRSWRSSPSTSHRTLSTAYGTDRFAQMGPEKCVVGFKLFDLPLLVTDDG